MMGPCRRVPCIRNVQSCLLKNPAPLGVGGESHACSHVPVEVFTLRIARSLKLQHSAGGVLRNGRYVVTALACSEASTPGPPQPALPPWSTHSVTQSSSSAASLKLPRPSLWSCRAACCGNSGPNRAGCPRVPSDIGRTATRKLLSRVPECGFRWALSSGAFEMKLFILR